MFRRLESGLLAGLLLSAAPAWADRTDRNQPMYLDADRVSIDDARQISTFDGSVRLTQGTLLISGDKIVISETADGDKHGTVTGQLAYFQQKREGLDEYIKGYGERIEYDTRNEFLELYGNASIKRADDEVQGDHITYDSKTEIFHVDGRRSADPAQRGRVRAVIQPRNKEALPPAEPVRIRPSASLEGKQP
jgi:lipopolysaccharide export system protein LptA